MRTAIRMIGCLFCLLYKIVSVSREKTNLSINYICKSYELIYTSLAFDANV